MSKRNPADLLSRIFHKDYPLNANTLSIVVGGAGSGKSYFCYNILLPIYLDHFDIYNLIICSRTAKCDATLNDALGDLERKYPHISAEMLELRELTGRCEEIRARAIKAEQLMKISRMASYREIEKYANGDLESTMDSMTDFEGIQSELYLFLDDLRLLLDFDSYIIQDTNKPQKKDGEDDGESSSSSSDDDGEVKLDFEREKTPDPEDFDINYVTHTQGLCINRKVFQDDKYKPRVEVDWEGRELTREEYEEKAERGIYEWLRKHIIKPRMKAEHYGPPAQPILAIVDDSVGDAELSNPKSKLTQMLFLRRHLHCAVFILSQSTIGINTNIRRNANSFHLLPSLSAADLDLINFRLPAHFDSRALREHYISNNQNGDRNQTMTSLFCVYPHDKLVDGAPPCVLKYYEAAQRHE